MIGVRRARVAWEYLVMKIPFIVIFCGNEKYIFYYSAGKEDELVCTMIDYAMDPRHAMTWTEVKSVMRHFGLLKSMAEMKESWSAGKWGEAEMG